MPRHEYRDPSAAPGQGGPARPEDGFPSASPWPGEAPSRRDARRPGGLRAVLGSAAGPGDAVGSRHGSEGGLTGRMLLVALVAIAVLVPFGVSSTLFWSHAGEDLSSTASERNGVEYLRPLVRLLAAAGDQQSRDLAGSPGTGAAVRTAIADVDAVDARLGDDLGTHDRWSNIRQRLQVLLQTPPAPAAAYQSFGQVVDLIVAMIGAVGDRAQLILDPDLDTYYLMDATLNRLPTILVDSARLTDLARGPAGVRNPLVAVLDAEVVQTSGALGTGMRKSFAATRTTAVSNGLVGALDRFADAVNAFTPPTTGGIADSGARLAADRDRVRDSALELESQALTQLDTLLQDRMDGLTGQRDLLLITVLVGLLVVGGVGWLVRRRRTPSDRQAARASGAGRASAGGAASGPPTAPVEQPVPAGGRPVAASLAGAPGYGQSSYGTAGAARPDAFGAGFGSDPYPGGGYGASGGYGADAYPGDGAGSGGVSGGGDAGAATDSFPSLVGTTRPGPVRRGQR